MIWDTVHMKGVIKFKIEAVLRARNSLNLNIFDNFVLIGRWDKISTIYLNDAINIIYAHWSTLRDQIEERNEGESGLTFEGISKIITKIAEATNNAVGSYIELPKSKSSKKATINIKTQIINVSSGQY